MTNENLRMKVSRTTLELKLNSEQSNSCTCRIWNRSKSEFWNSKFI